MRRLLIALLALTLALPTAVAGTAAAAPPRQPPPLERAHAHNDYEHDRPLLDALDRGFTSVEADVFFSGDDLLIGHDPQDLRPGVNLISLYLEPLRERVQRHGAVHPDARSSFTLLVDVKTEPESTYAELDRQLAQYADILTTYGTADGVDEGPVTVIVSGFRARETMKAQPVRYAAYDGRLSDLEGEEPASFIPLISDNYNNNFSWRGEGPMPPEEREKLRRIVETAHADGRRVRLYGAPDEPGPQRDALWSELLAADVDQINTDDLDGLRDWLIAHDPQARRGPRRAASAAAA